MTSGEPARRSARPSICIVAHLAYGAMTGGMAGHVGGVEHQTSLTARWLARRGYAVSLIVWNEGQPDEVEIDGVRVLSMCAPHDGPRGLRFFHPRWTSLNRAMRRAHADVYYQNCGEYVTGQVALWCRRHGRPFVYSVASDPECDPAVPMLSRAHDRLLFRYGLQHADRIIVQTRRQQRMLKEGSRLDSVVLPMPCPGPDDREFVPPAPPSSGARPKLVWVGRISSEKRLSLLLDVAAAVPEVDFEIVGPAPTGDAAADALLSRAGGMLNVSVAGRVRREDMPRVYMQAAGLICTSSYEGFPNTFLEAWSHGLPVVSTVDPDDLIREKSLGYTAADAAGLAAGVRRLVESPDSWRGMSQRARAHYRLHRVDEALPRFERVFNEAGAVA